MLEAIYNHAPVWLQNVMCSVKGWLLQRRRFGKGFFVALEELEQHRVNPENELNHFLAQIRNVPAYAGVFAKACGRDVRIEDFPIINKGQVKERLQDYLNPDFHGRMFWAHTSGTTGSGMVFPNSVAFENRQWAVWWRYREQLGLKFGTWCGWLGCAHMVVPIDEKNPPFWRVNAPGHQVMFSPYHLNADNVALYLEEIKRRGLTWLHGYASNVRYLCRLALDRGLPPVSCVQFVTTGAENLLPEYVSDIQKVFPNAMVRTHYGQTEGVANFSQTKEGDWVIDADFAFVELIPVDSADPNRCRVVGTSFSNLAFPLVRYDIGDIVKVSWEDGAARIIDVEGRDNEFFLLKDGTKISTMRSYDIFKEMGNVVEAQVCLHENDGIELRVVKGTGYCDKDEKEILALSKKYLGKASSVRISYVEKVPRTKNGKFKALVKE